MAKKILTLLLTLGLILSASLVPAFADGEITITSPLNGSTVKAGTVTLSAAAEGAETVEFYLDGELVKSFAAGENASFDADVKGMNRHEIKLLYAEKVFEELEILITQTSHTNKVRIPF